MQYSLIQPCMNLQLTRQMSILNSIAFANRNKQRKPSWKAIQFLNNYMFAALFTWIGWINQIVLLKLTCQGQISIEVRNITATDAWKEITNPPASLFQNKSYAKSLWVFSFGILLNCTFVNCEMSLGSDKLSIDDEKTLHGNKNTK